MREDLQLLSYAALLEFEAIVDSSGMHSSGVPNNQLID